MPSLRSLLVVIVGLAGSQAAAQDPRSLVISLIRANGCAITDADAERVFSAQGVAREVVGAVAQGLEATGEASFGEDGSQMILSEEMCRPTAEVFLEQEIGSLRGCRIPLSDLVARAEELFLYDPAEVDAGLAALAAAGKVVPDGAEVALATCAEGPVVEPDPVRRIEAMGAPYWRGLVALHLMRNGCRVTPDARAGLVAELAAAEADKLVLGSPVPPEAVAAAAAGIEEVLDNPGPAYEIDPATGDLVMIHCTP